MSKQSDRLSDDNPYNHIRQKTNEEWILYWICEDPDFKQLMTDYVHQFESKTKVINGKVRDSMTKSELEYAMSIRQSALTRFGLMGDEFDTIQTGMHTQSSFDFPFEYLGYDEDGGVKIKIPRDIKRIDYIVAWGDIKEMLEPTYQETPFGKEIDSNASVQKRIRAADDTRLIYAIFKARKAGLKFSEIFKLYQSGALPAYKDMPTNQYSSEDSLERHYSKHKPDR